MLRVSGQGIRRSWRRILDLTSDIQTVRSWPTLVREGLAALTLAAPLLLSVIALFSRNLWWMLPAMGFVGVLVVVPRAVGSKTDLDAQIVHLFEKSVVGAWSEAEAVWQHVVGELRTSGPAGYVAARLTEEFLMRSVRDSFERLREAVQRADGLTDALYDFYVDYQRQVVYLRDAGMACGFGWDQDGNFRLWKGFDSEWLSGLREIAARPDAEHLRRKVHGYMWVALERDYWA